ncbi:MAG: cation diffusion facilitator family transporter [Acidobacteriota bacterium]|nr:cation diffusion facilitator family transporter [Acidobacteriota bacterium]
MDDGQRSAPVIAGAVALVLVAVKLTVGFYSGSMALIASAADSGLDFLVSAFNAYAIHNAGKPSDDRYNYGRGKLEGLAAFLEGLVIGLSALIIIGTAALKLARQDTVTHTTPAIWVMIFSTVLTAALVIYLRMVSKRTGNLVIKADSLHYQIDLWTNMGILTALFLIQYIELHWLDGAISILIGFMILKGAHPLVRDGANMLLDRALDPKLIQEIDRIIRAKDSGVADYHRLKTRQAADIFFVDVHLVFNHDISLLAAHRHSERVEEQIRALAPKHTWEINCHLDPEDDSQRDKVLESQH